MEYQITITGTIGCWWNSASFDYVQYVLNQNKGKEVHVGFSSYGGYVKDGLDLYQAFKNHGNVHAHAFGMNASISTIAMLGCKTIDIVKGSFFLIHNTSTMIDTYSQKNKDDLDAYIKNLTKQKDDLATFDDVLAQMYADKTGKTKEECAAQMNKGNWMSAQEAVDFGLVDSIYEDDKDEKATVEITNLFMNNYKNNKEAGIPPLPKQQQPVAAVADSEGNPTPTFLQKTLQGIKNLLHKSNVEETHIEMSKPTLALAAITAALAVDSLPTDDKGQVVLTAEQAKKLNELITEPAEDNRKEKTAPKAEGVVKTEPLDEVAQLRNELAKVKNDLATKDEQIKNLQKNPAPEDKTNDNPADEHPQVTAFDIAESIKDI